MNWFYTTRDQTQAGPVDEATLDGLFRSGAITTETLVWKEGMENWLPYSMVFKPSTPAPQTSYAPVSAGLRCAECGQTFPPEQLITLAGRSVCGACKPLALQKFAEGVSSFGAAMSADELWERAQQRGFNFTIGSVLSRSWTLVKGNFWPCLGVTLLCYLIMMGAGQIPLLGLLATFFVQPQIMAGLNWYFIKQFRGESATVNDSFAGFRRGYGQQALYMLILMAIMVVVVIACIVPMVFIMPALSSGKANGGESTAMVAMFALMIPVILVIWYFTLSWIFTPLLILEKGLNATAAMKLSRRVVGMRFWKMLLLFLVVALLCLAGLLVLIVGVLVMLPVAFAVISRVYEDAFGEEGPVTTV